MGSTPPFFTRSMNAGRLRRPHGAGQQQVHPLPPVRGGLRQRSGHRRDRSQSARPALHVGADGQAEGLAQSGADGRSGLNNYDLLWIVDGRKDLVGNVLFVQRAHRAGGDALAAG